MLQQTRRPEVYEKLKRHYVIMDDILHPEEPQVDIKHDDELDSLDLV
jgi:hypothetical protein